MVLRRCGRGNWSVVRLEYDPARQGQLPAPVEARVGARVTIDGVEYRVVEVMS